MNVADEIRQKTDIVDVIGQYTRLTKSGKTLKGLCPFHAEKHGSFFVYPDQQTWHCFGACATGGDVFSFIMKKEGLGFRETMELLAERIGFIIPQSQGYEHVREHHDRLTLANEMAAEYYHQSLLKDAAAEPVRQYLGRRGLNAAAVATFKLGYSANARYPLKTYLAERGFSEAEMLAAGLITETERGEMPDRFRHRLMFPIYDARGRPVGFGARALDESMPKYLNTTQTALFDKSSSLYALHLAREKMRKLDQAVIVEGYMDVIVAHQYGFDNVVACMGTAISESHCQTLKKITRNVVLALDADSAGEAAMIRAVGLENTLAAEMRMIVLPPGKDPDEVIIADEAAWRNYLQHPVPVMDFIFDKAVAPLDMKTPSGREQAAEKLLPVVGQIVDPIRRVYYANKLAELTQVNKYEIQNKLQQNQLSRYTRRAPPAAGTPRRITAHPLEERCLALLIKHPELIPQCQQLAVDHFTASENREVFRVIMNRESTGESAELADPTLTEHFRDLSARSFPEGQLEEKLREMILRLREEQLKRLARNDDEPASAAGDQLRQVFIEKDKLGLRKRRNS